jgi:hypothetical protein
VKKSISTEAVDWGNRRWWLGSSIAYKEEETFLRYLRGYLKNKINRI